MQEKGNIKITPSVLTRTAADVRKINGQLSDKLEDINRQMQALNETWQSDAGEEIRGAMAELKKVRFGLFKETVESYAKYLDETAKSYESTEDANTQNAQEVSKSSAFK